MLTDAQKATLKAYIAAQPDLAVFPDTADGAYEIAQRLNAATSHVVWRSSVPTAEIAAAISYVALDAMTIASQDRLKTFYVLNPVSFDPSRADIRSYFAGTFSGALGGQGQATRDALEARWRRTATRLEQLFAIGTGSTSQPATLVVEGTISYQEVQAARAG